ncbi:MAG: tRNA adenosine deaminase-associated protein [Actinomycetes bacterium]
MAEDTLVDFALVAFREDGQWQVCELQPRAAEDLDSLVAAVRQQPSEGVTLAICSYGDDFFLAVRPAGEEVRLLLSDVSAVGEWPIARQVLDALDDSGDAEPDDLETVQPAGDLDIFADLGVSAMEVAAVCSDLELYPDEMLTQIAARIGFGQQFDQAVDADLA